MRIDNSVLLLIATVASFAFLVLLVFVPIPDKNVQIILALSGVVLGFFFGSAVNRDRKEVANVPIIPAPDAAPDA